MIEKERYSPSLMLAYRMAEVSGMSVEELYCLKERVLYTLFAGLP